MAKISVDIAQLREAAARHLADAETILNLCDGVQQLHAENQKMSEALQKALLPTAPASPSAGADAS